MSRNYKFHNPEGLYFISFAVVGWLYVFARNEYKDLFLEGLVYCQKNKGLEIHAYCLMSSLFIYCAKEQMVLFCVTLCEISRNLPQAVANVTLVSTNKDNKKMTLKVKI